MINIFDTTKLNGMKFNVTQDTQEWTCIGVGTPPDAGRPYIVGLCFNAPDNRTQIDTFPFAKVRFLGNIAG
jgi:hypothetical protein